MPPTTSTSPLKTTLPSPPPPPKAGPPPASSADLTAWATGRGSDGTSPTGRRRPSRPTFAPLTLSSQPSSLKVPTDASHLLPVLSPVAASASASHSPDRPYFPGQPKSLSGIAVRAFCLGASLALSVVATAALLLLGSTPLWRLPFFLGALSAFHFLEFLTTAAYNTPAASVDSFLLTANWPAYAVAHATAALECLVVSVAFPRRAWAPLHTGPLLLLLGMALVVAGQVVRSAAMAQAGPSFNHTIQHRKGASHALVTTGIYATLRHPSYFGFFWWALGTQLVLGNVVCFFAYAAVLWHFFSARVRHEEETLVRFFGEEYEDYRRKVGTKIPFVP